MSLAFNNLPLVEATVRFSLREEFRLPLTAEFVRDLLEELAGQYDVVSYAQEELPPGIQARITIPGPHSVSGLHLITNSGSTAMLVFPGLIGARWRGIGSKDYVGFESLERLVAKVRRAIGNMLGAAPPIAVANIYYVNEIACSDRSDISKWLKPSILPGIIEFGSLLKQEAIWKDPRGDIRIALEYQERPESSPSFVLTTSSGHALELQNEDVDLAAADKALGQVHELLGLNFVQIITDHAKHEWGMQQ